MTPEDLDYWGRCPNCGGNDGCLNVGGAHWFVCNRHRTKWYAGYNLFSVWRREPSSVHRENAELLATYEEVQPLHRTQRGQADHGLLPAAHGRAMDAALLLVAAYRTGRLDGGHVEWSDLDAAHEVAREAAALAARHRRQSRRAAGRADQL